MMHWCQGRSQGRAPACQVLPYNTICNPLFTYWTGEHIKPQEEPCEECPSVVWQSEANSNAVVSLVTYRPREQASSSWHENALNSLLVKTVLPRRNAMLVACWKSRPPSFRDLSRSSRSLCGIKVKFVAVKLSSTVEPSFDWKSLPSPRVHASSC